MMKIKAICFGEVLFDKTGTLTQGEMRVAQIVGESEARDIKDIDSAEAEAEYGLSLRIGLLCNNAFFMSASGGEGPSVALRPVLPR